MCKGIKLERLRIIQILQWLENFNKMNDKQLQKFAKQQQLEFSIEEIQQLRKILNKATISWGIYGVPPAIREEVKQIIGSKKYKLLQKIIGF